MRGNCIILKNPCEAGNLKDCQIQYEIEYIEPNIMYKANKNYLSLQLENTKQKWVLLLVKFEEVMSNSKLCFFIESGHLIQREDITKNLDGYVVLAAINHDTKIVNDHEPFSEEEVSMAKKIL